MNFYKLNLVLREAGYDSQVVPGGQTIASQPMQSPQPTSNNPQSVNVNQPVQPQQSQTPQAQSQDINHLLQKVSSKLGNNINKYKNLVSYLKNKPEMLNLFAQSLEDVGSMQSSTFKSVN